MVKKNKSGLKRTRQRRTLIQTVASLLTNANFKGFLQGRIFEGNTKAVCLPGLNCYSCPGAIGSCPIGSLQAVLGSMNYKFAYYVFGILIFFGVLLGRLVCGFLCPFGWIQDLLYKIPLKKISLPLSLDKGLRYLKYVLLLTLVILFPIVLTDALGIAPPYFCEWVCPAGTLGGAVPLLSMNPFLRQSIGFLFAWKMGILIITVLASIVIYRPFCKYLCPLGAFYGLFNKLGFYKIHVDKDKCTSCMACEKVCKMNVAVTKDCNSPECIRCGDCKSVCNHGAIKIGYFAGMKEKDKDFLKKEI